MKNLYLFLLYGLFCAATFTTHAQNGTIGNISWSFAGGTLTISGTGAMPDFEYDTDRPWHSLLNSITRVQIDNGVSNIGELAFGECANLTSADIPSSVTSIGDAAFYYCSKLSSLTIPSSVTSIGAIAFGLCSSLPSVTIPPLVTSIGQMAFAGCSGLTTLTIPPAVTSIGEGAFRSCTGLTEVNYNAINCTHPIADYNSFYSVFNGCSSLKTVHIGNGVINIPECAFYQCTELTSVTIPNSIKEISPWTFAYCSGLTDIVLPSSLTSIGSNAFAACSGLESVTIPVSVTSIDEYAFAGCSKLSTVNFNATNCATMGSVVENGDFKTVFNGCPALTTVNIGSNVIRIPDYAFADLSGLRSVTIPEAITSVGKRAFAYCSNLSTVNFNAVNCTAMGGFNEGGYAIVFGNCPALAIVNIGNTVTRIPDYAFRDLVALTSVTIPEAITTIGKGAFAFSGLNTVDFKATNCTTMGSVDNNGEIYSVFYECGNLENLIIRDNVIRIPDYAFGGLSGLKTVTIPSGTTSIGKGAFENCIGLKTVNYHAVNCLVDKISPFRYCTALTDLSIAADVTKIPDYLFAYTGLKSVSIPNTVTFIGNETFSVCSELTTVTIGNSVTEIGEYAFAACDQLSTVNFNATNCTKMGSILENGDFKNVFNRCPALTTLNIGNNVTRIPDYAFAGFGLSSVTIPEAITFIGGGAFAYCNNLSTINFNAVNCTMGSATENGHTPVFGSDCQTLKTLNIGNRVTMIPDYAFPDLGNLSSVTIPESVTFIGKEAFAGCSSLSDFYVLNPDPITVSATMLDFDSYGKVCLHVPAGSEVAYAAALVWQDFGCLSGNGEVTGVLLDRSALPLITGASETLTATVTPDNATNKTVTWSSSNTAVATVSNNGTVTAVATGTAVITVTTESGAKTATCTVNVTTPPIAPEDEVSIGGNVAGAPIGTEVQLYKASVPDEYDLVASTTTDASGNYLFDHLQPGMYFVKIIMPGVESTPSDPISLATGETANDVNFTVKGNTVVPGNDITGVGEIFAPDLKAYPNPFTDAVHITGANGCTLRVINAAGTTVYTQNIENPDETIRLEHLPTGMYFFHIEKSGRVKTVKMVKN